MERYEVTEVIEPMLPMINRSGANDDTTLIDLFIRNKRSENTKAAYILAIEQFRAFCDKPLAHVTVLDIQDYADHLRQRYNSTHTRNLKLNAIKSLLTFAAKTGYLPFNVGTAVEAEKTVTIFKDKVLGESQIIDLLNTVENEKHNLLIRLLYASGGRVSEVCALK